MRAAGATIVDDFTVPGFENFPRPPQTAARSKADWESLLCVRGSDVPGQDRRRAARLAENTHPLHAARIAEIAAVTQSPEQDPETVKGRADEEMYRQAFAAAMDAARVDALVFPVWNFPPRINGDRGQTPQGPLTFIGSATQWPVAVVPMGFVDETLPVGIQIFGRPWSEPELIKYAYAYEQATHHRRPPPTVPPLESSFASKFIGTWKLVAIRDRRCRGRRNAGRARRRRWPARLLCQRPAVGADRAHGPRTAPARFRRWVRELLRPLGAIAGRRLRHSSPGRQSQSRAERPGCEALLLVRR